MKGAAHKPTDEVATQGRANTEPLPLLLTFEETARQLSVSLTTVKTLVADGRLPTVYVYTCRRVRRSEVLALLDRLPTEPW